MVLTSMRGTRVCVALRECRGQGRGEKRAREGGVEIRSGVNGKFHGKFMTFHGGE